MTASARRRTLCNMSFQPPHSGPGGPPRSTPIPGDSYSPSADQFNQAPLTPSAFLGGQADGSGQPTAPPQGQGSYAQQLPYGQPGPTGFPTIAYQKRKRSWAGRIAVMFFLLIFIGGMGVGGWAVMKGIDAANTGSDLANPNLSGGDLDSLDLGGEEQFLYEGAAASAVVAALDAGIPGEPTQFTDISLYTDYAIGTAQDPTMPGRFDQYIWRTGTVNPPTPQPDDPDSANVTFTIDEVNWNAITALAADAPRLAGVDGGAVSYIIVSRDAIIEVGPIVVRIYVNGPRGSGVVEATAAGEFVKAF